MKMTFQGRERIKKHKREKASLYLERKLWKKGYKYVACLDEAGRGPLAGPVVAAAVVIKNPALTSGAGRGLKFKAELNNNSTGREKTAELSSNIQNLKDSKKLSPQRREQFYKAITKSPFIRWGIAKASEKVIDRINIKNAAELAMEKALKNLERKTKRKVDFLLIDGNSVKNLKLKSYNLKLMVRADEKVFSCACASILAKVTRDRLMMRYHKEYPKYGFDLHKGYPTKEHIRKLKKYKPCKIHRKSFGPVLESLKRKAQSVKRKT